MFATKTVVSGLIPGQVKPKTIKNNAQNISARSALKKNTAWSLHHVCVRLVYRQVAALLKDRKVPYLVPSCQDTLVGW